MKQKLHLTIQRIKRDFKRKRKFNNNYEFWGMASLLLIAAVDFTPLKSILNSGSLVGGLFWCAAVVALVRLAPGVSVRARRKTREAAIVFSITGALVCLAVIFMVSIFMNSLGSSPYDHSPSGIFMNAFRIFPALLFRERTREYILFIFQRTQRVSALFLIALTLFMSLTDINLTKLGSLEGAEELAIFMSRDVLESISENALLTYLCIAGGYRASFIYAGINKAFKVFFPLLPSLPWIGDAALKVSIPIIIIMFSAGRLFGSKSREAANDDGNIVKSIVAVTFTVILCWFSVGMFPVFPSIVLTGSMEPLIKPGDIVLIEKIRDESEIYELREGDIINFKRDDITITHRIMIVEEDEAGNVSFVTKGDNNDSADGQIVMPNDVKGTVVGTIPKVGIPILAMYSMQDVPEGVVD